MPPISARPLGARSPTLSNPPVVVVLPAIGRLSSSASMGPPGAIRPWRPRYRSVRSCSCRYVSRPACRSWIVLLTSRDALAQGLCGMTWPSDNTCIRARALRNILETKMKRVRSFHLPFHPHPFARDVACEGNASHAIERGQTPCGVGTSGFLDKQHLAMVGRPGAGCAWRCLRRQRHSAIWRSQRLPLCYKELVDESDRHLVEELFPTPERPSRRKHRGYRTRPRPLILRAAGGMCGRPSASSAGLRCSRCTSRPPRRTARAAPGRS